MRHVKTDDPSSDQALMQAFVARDERAAGALYDRFASRGEAQYADQLLSAMRAQFGGHAEKVAA